MGYIESGRSDEGARSLPAGIRLSHPGFYVKPTVMANVKRSMRVVQEEIFGPVLVAQRFDDLDEVAALANDTPYGLSASIWSNDLKAVHRLIPKIKRRHGVGEHAWARRREHAVRRLQAFGYRPRARPRRHRDVHGAEVRVHARVSVN